jgi:serine/threonine-protein kinase RIM15
VSEPSRALIEEEDEQHTISARFRLQSASPVNDASKTQWELGTKFRTMVGTGLLMHGLNAEPSHFMWAIKPEGLVLSELVQQQEDADAEEDERVAEEQEEEAAAGLRPGPPETPQPGPRFHSRLVTQPVTPFPTSSLINTQILLCRICEREVPTWYFEKHSETCHEIHRLEADISEQNDKVSEILQEAETLLAMYDPQDRSPTPTYRGTAVTSRMQNALPLSPEKYRQAQHAAQRNLIEQVIDTLRLCLEISTPSLKDENSDLPIDEQRLLSPRSENHLSALSIWSRPTTEDEALTRLIDDSLLVTRGKINAVNRLRNTVVYSERVRHEWQEKVERGLQQAEQEALGEGSDETSSGEESAHTAEEGVNLASTQTLPPAEPMSSGLHLMVPGMSADTSSSTSPSDVAGGDGPPRLSRHHRRLSSRTDYTDFSTSPSLPSSFPAEASPTRRRRKTSGRLSVGSETPLSPRLPCITPASRSTTITIKDFEMLKPISKGAFGSVYLARKKVTGDFYAIKILRKADMISKNQITNVKAERKILMTQSESPYVVRLFFTFRAPSYSPNERCSVR